MKTCIYHYSVNIQRCACTVHVHNVYKVTSTCRCTYMNKYTCMLLSPYLKKLRTNSAMDEYVQGLIYTSMTSFGKFCLKNKLGRKSL